MREIRQLTGLRGVVAFDVVFGHYGEHLTRFAHHFIFLDAAVDIFFCLSSFTLCLVYPLAHYQKFSFYNFAIARLARIYPIYLFSLLFSAGLILWFFSGEFGYGHRAHTYTHLFSQLFLVAALPIPKISGFWDIPAWSISVETFCYILVFPVFFFLTKLLRSSKAGYILGVIVVLCAIDFMGFTQGYEPLVNGIDYGTATTSFAYWVALLRGISMFTAGFLTYALWAHTTIFSRLNGWVTDALVLMFICVVISTNNGIGHPQIVVFFAPFLLAGLMDDHCITSRLLSTSACVFLGRISYSLYLMHVPVLIAYHLAPMFNPGPADFWAPFVMSLVLAVVCFYGLETPARRYIRRWQRA